MTQLVGSLILVLTVVLTVLGVVATMRQPRWLGLAVFLVAALAVGLETWQAMVSYAEEQRVRRRVTEAIRFLVDEADFAAQLEIKMRGDPRPDTKEKLAEYVGEIERWRTRTSDGLKEKFPRTGADRLFLAAVGDVGLVNGLAASRKIYYEYTRLRHCQAALFAILASVDAFVQREQLVESGQGIAGRSEKAATGWRPPSSDGLLALSTLALALFTLVLVIVSCLQWRTLDTTHKSNKLIERAYVGLSHMPRSFQLLPGPPLTSQVEIRVKNYGNTPARVIAVSLEPWVSQAPLPKTPPDLAALPDTGYFLVARDRFFMQRSLQVPTATYPQVQAGTLTLYLLGCVDYEDQFRQRHRSRYARRCVFPSPGGTPELVFVTEPGYNDDR